jgi:hypothetical protein
MTDLNLPNPSPTVTDLLTTERLTVPQRRFLEHFAPTVFKRRFYLSGGAALSAGYLGHRFSDDLDFFGPDPVPIKKLVPFMEQLPGLESLQWLLPRERTTFMITWDDGSQVKVEYRQFPFSSLAAPHSVGPFYLDSMQDLLANKLYALIERRYELDRTDIYGMLRCMSEVTVEQAVSASEQKFNLKGLVQDAVLRRLGGPLPDGSPEALFVPIDVKEMAQFFHDRGAPLARAR